MTDSIRAKASETAANQDWLAARFEDHRAHLRAVAYRMLGSGAEAEDAVQDAWLRASRAGASDVENLGGWLTTIVARLCLDRLRARAARREDPAGLEMAELDIVLLDDAGTGPGVSPGGAADPERQALLADAVGMAMLIVLDRLSPAERLAFVLHDTFGLPFEAIAPIVDRSPVATRKLASRARQRVRGAAPGPDDVPLARQRELVEAFVAASRAGDFEALLRILDPNVVVRADTAAIIGPYSGAQEVHGAPAVAAQAMAFRQFASGARLAIVNGAIGAVVYSKGRPFAAVRTTVRGDRITMLEFVLRTERLRRIGAGL